MAIAMCVSKFYLFARPDEIRSYVAHGYDVAVTFGGRCDVALAHGHRPMPLMQLHWSQFHTDPQFAHVYGLVSAQGRHASAFVDAVESITIAHIDTVDPGYVPPTPPEIDVESIRELIQLVPESRARQRSVWSCEPTGSARPADVAEDQEWIVDSISIETVLRSDSRTFLTRLIDWLRETFMSADRPR
jgi:hypothetical protein